VQSIFMLHDPIIQMKQRIFGGLAGTVSYFLQICYPRLCYFSKAEIGLSFVIPIIFVFQGVAIQRHFVDVY